MATFTVTIDGKQHEVEQGAIQLPENHQILGPDSIPDGFVKQSVMDAKISQRVQQAKANALKEAASDETVRNQVLSELGIDLDDEGKPKGLETQKVDLEKEREKWEVNRLKPIQTKLEETESNLNTLRDTSVRQSIRNAFAGKAKDEYLDSEIGSPYVEQVFSPKFRYNPEIGNAALYDKENDSFELHPNGKQANSHGYITPDDYIKLNADSKLMKRILKDESQGGSGFSKGGGGDSKQITRKQFDEMDANSRQKAMSNGVQIVD